MNDARLIDSHKLMFHPNRVAQWLESGDEWEKAKSVYPVYVEVSPMGACNHRCTFCAVDYIGYKAVQLDEDEISMTLSEMGKLGVKSVMFAGEGEPLLHKKINAITRSALDAGVHASFTTNGVLLDKLDLNGVSWVKVSLNAGTEATYRAVHGAKAGDWGRVWANLLDAVRRKGDCEIGVQMVLLPENAHEAPLLQRLCDEIGIDYVVFKPYSQHKKSITRKYAGYKPIEIVGGKSAVVRKNAIETTDHGYDRCNATPFFWAYVMATGDVYSCSAYLLDDRFRLGNINEQTFREIWEGERRRANWELVTKKLDIHECRVNCRMDKANRYLADFERVKGINFI